MNSTASTGYRTSGSIGGKVKGVKSKRAKKGLIAVTRDVAEREAGVPKWQAKK